MEKEKITAIMWYMGCTKTKAKKYLKTMEPTCIALIAKTFKDNCKKAFYVD